MATLYVFLKDDVGLGTVQGSVQSGLEALFQQLFTRATQLSVPCAFDSVQVRWTGGCPALGSKDLLVYFVAPPNGQSGFVCNETTFGTRGLTTWTAQGVTRSDVYVPPCDAGANPMASVLTNLAFHELMHNKLHLNNQQLHGRGGLAGGSVGPATSLTDANVRLMAPALDNAHAQDTSGLGCSSSNAFATPGPEIVGRHVFLPPAI